MFPNLFTPPSQDVTLSSPHKLHKSAAAEYPHMWMLEIMKPLHKKENQGGGVVGGRGGWNGVHFI